MQNKPQDKLEKNKPAVHPAVPEEADPDAATVDDPQRGEHEENKPERRVDRTVDAPGG